MSQKNVGFTATITSSKSNFFLGHLVPYLSALSVTLIQSYRLGPNFIKVKNPHEYQIPKTADNHFDE